MIRSASSLSTRICEELAVIDPLKDSEPDGLGVRGKPIRGQCLFEAAIFRHVCQMQTS